MKLGKFIRTVSISLTMLTSVLCFASVEIDSISQISQDSDFFGDQGIPIIDQASATSLPQSSRAGRSIGNNCYASYEINKYGLDWTRNGNTITYQIAISNIGDCNLTNLVIHDYFPKHTSFKHAFPKPDEINSSSAVWYVKWLPVGRTAYFNIKFEVRDCNTNQWITNTGCVWTASVGQRACAWASTWVNSKYLR